MSADVAVRPPVRPVYLGDAVYASFDGYHIWLHLNSHDSPGLIALEPDVYAALVSYRNSIYRRDTPHDAIVGMCPGCGCERSACTCSAEAQLERDADSSSLQPTKEST